jgi:hypothetical protein
MARYSATFTSVTMTATADATNLANTTYAALLQGGNGTMRLNVGEIYLGGESAAAAICTAVFARDSTVGATVVAGSTRNAVTDASNQAPGTVAVVGNSATTLPQRSATLHLLHPSFNAFGGISRWQARPGEDISIVGNTASLGEASLSMYTGGTGIASGHILYEVA